MTYDRSRTAAGARAHGGADLVAVPRAPQRARRCVGGIEPVVASRNVRMAWNIDRRRRGRRAQGLQAEPGLRIECVDSRHLQPRGDGLNANLPGTAVGRSAECHCFPGSCAAQRDGWKACWSRRPPALRWSLTRAEHFFPVFKLDVRLPEEMHSALGVPCTKRSPLGIDARALLDMTPGGSPRRG